MKNKTNIKLALATLPLLLLGSYSPLSFAASDFIKDTKTGCKIYDLDEAKYSASWSGACEGGKVNGEGMLIILDKARNVSCENEGKMKAGLKTGHHVVNCSDGMYSEGNFKPVRGGVSGEGFVRYPSGNKIEVEFKGWDMRKKNG